MVRWKVTRIRCPYLGYCFQNAHRSNVYEDCRPFVEPFPVSNPRHVWAMIHKSNELFHKLGSKIYLYAYHTKIVNLLNASITFCIKTTWNLATESFSTFNIFGQLLPQSNDTL